MIAQLPDRQRQAMQLAHVFFNGRFSYLHNSEKPDLDTYLDTLEAALKHAKGKIELQFQVVQPLLLRVADGTYPPQLISGRLFDLFCSGIDAWHALSIEWSRKKILSGEQRPELRPHGVDHEKYSENVYQWQLTKVKIALMLGDLTKAKAAFMELRHDSFHSINSGLGRRSLDLFRKF